MDQETAQKILEQTKIGYNQIADLFSVTRVWPWKVMDNFFSYLKEGNRILDVGCGNGRLYEAIKEKKVEYSGIDNSSSLIKIAQDKYGKDKFEVNDILKLFFNNEMFDAVFMIAVLSHIPSKELQVRALENAYQVLEPNSYLFITCWNLWQPRIFWKNLKNRIKNPNLYDSLGWQDFLITWRNSQREILSQRFYHVFTKKELEKLLKKAGFKVEKIFYEYKGEKSNWLKGFNLVAIARK